MLVDSWDLAPVSRELDNMDKDTIAKAHSLISKILNDIPTVHTTWIEKKSMTLGDNSTRQQLQLLKEHMIPSAPVLHSISNSFSLETCLAHIVEGLQLHVNLLNEISKSTFLNKTDGVEDLIAEIEELLCLIKKLQNLDQSKQASDKQTHKHDLAKHLTNKYRTRAAAHLTLHQLQEFGSDVLRSILSMRNMSI
ncbi:colony stimulating factor 3 (granulocyte) a [Pseudorasbora parva]|uniref:colony stimulating factor 3 (granulocyte) a n=1 Tax=Pseudorasbora parva TaxID=51549 RepID=UPI00351EFA49